MVAGPAANVDAELAGGSPRSPLWAQKKSR
jgi:hypothetical protein